MLLIIFLVILHYANELNERIREYETLKKVTTVDPEDLP